MTKPKYTPEIRDRAVQLLIESEKDRTYALLFIDSLW